MKHLFPEPLDQKSLDDYFELIENARLGNHSEYKERHHILPVSMGGTNDKNNLIALSAEMHYEAHYLLWKSFRNRSMTNAFHLMTWNKKDRRRITKEEFKILREDYSKSKQEYWNLLTDEEKDSHRKKSNPWLNKSAEEIYQYKEILREKSKNQWTDERKKEHSQKMKECESLKFNNRSEETEITRLKAYKKTVQNRTTEDKAKMNYGNNKGSMWINDGISNRMIKRDSEIPIGWVKGRLIT